MPIIKELITKGVGKPFLKLALKFSQEFNLEIENVETRKLATKQYMWSRFAIDSMPATNNSDSYKIWAVSCVQQLLNELSNDRLFSFSPKGAYTGTFGELREKVILYPETAVSLKFIIAIHKDVFLHIHRDNNKLYSLKNPEKSESRLIIEGLDKIASGHEISTDFQSVLSLPRI